MTPLFSVCIINLWHKYVCFPDLKDAICEIGPFGAYHGQAFTDEEYAKYGKITGFNIRYLAIVDW